MRKAIAVAIIAVCICRELDDLCLAAGGGGGEVQQYEVERISEGTKGIFVEEKDYDKDDAKELRVENRFLRLIFEPEVGGVIGSLVLKKHGNDLTTRRAITVPGGLLSDKLDGQGYGVDWNEGRYEYKIDRQPDRVVVTLWMRGKSGVLGYLTFRKRVTVYEDSACIDVDYELHNHKESGSSLTHGIWFHNMAGGPIRETSLFFPMAPGIMRFDPKEMTAHDAWLREPARGWTAVIEETHNTGLAARIDYRYLKLFYTWFFNYPRSTWEWRFLPNPIPQGESFETRLSFLPFAGLDKINGATGEVAGSLDLKGALKAGAPTTIEAKFCGARHAPADVLLRTRRLPGKEWTTVETKKIALRPVEPVDVALAWTPPQDGTYVLQAVVNVEGKEPCILEEPAYVGKASAAYQMEPECQRVSAEPIFDPRKVDLSFTSGEVETPHVKWAKPYAGGRVSAAFFPAGIQIHREVVELAQRFDIEPATSVNILGSAQHAIGEYYGKLNPSLVRSKVNALLNPSREYDVLVFSGDTWDHLTDFSKSRVRELVEAGAGLVWIDPSTKDERAYEMLPVAGHGRGKQSSWQPAKRHFLTRGIPFDALPKSWVASWEGVNGEVVATSGSLPLVVLGECGKGRVVVLNYAVSGRLSRGLLPRTSAYPNLIPYPYWEYQYSLLGRATLWAARREPTVGITQVLPSGRKLIAIVDAKTPAAATLNVRLRDEYDACFHEASTSLELAAGENRVGLALPSLPTQRCRAHLFLKMQGKTADWFALTLSSDARMSLGEIKLDKDAYDRGDNVRATTSIQPQAPDQPLQLEVNLLDGYGRLVTQERHKVTSAGPVNVAFPLAHMICMRGIVEARLLRDRVQLDRKRAPFIVRPSRAWDDFETIIWAGGVYAGGHESLYGARMRVMKQIGMTGIVQNPYDYRPAWIAAFADHNIKIVTKGSARNAAQHGAKYGALLNMYGDERSVSEVRTPEGVALVREWLKRYYPSLEALNREWATEYGTWDEVTPMLKLEEAIARNKEKGFTNFAPWADYRLYLTHRFANQFRQQAKELTAVDPPGRMGISGTQAASTKSGNDWWMLTNIFKALQNYGRSQLHKSFADIRLAPWAAGYGARGPRVRVRYWQSLFQGCSGCSSWCEQTLVNPDLTLFKAASEGRRAIDEIRRGPGKLLMSCQQLFDPIAFHYSQASLHGAHALGKERTLNASRDAMVSAFVALGYQPFYLSYEQIERGELLSSGARIFIMPYSVAISAKEAEQIRAFVQAGGFVLADVFPGRMNEHCRALPKGQLDDVFATARARAEPENGGQKPSPSSGSNLLSLAGARAICLDGDEFSLYPSWAANRHIPIFRKKAELVEALVGSVAGQGTCGPRARVTLKNGTPSRSCFIYAFGSGKNLYLGTIGGAPKPDTEATVTFPQEAYVHEVISGRSFGRTKSVTVALGPHSVHLFALLSYEVAGLALEHAGTVKRGQVLDAPLRVVTRPGPAETHVVRLTAHDPSGAEVPHYAANVLLKDGVGKITIPFALSDAEGEWTLRFRDVATGRVMAKKVRVE